MKWLCARSLGCRRNCAGVCWLLEGYPRSSSEFSFISCIRVLLHDRISARASPSTPPPSPSPHASSSIHPPPLLQPHSHQDLCIRRNVSTPPTQASKTFRSHNRASSKPNYSGSSGAAVSEMEKRIGLEGERECLGFEVGVRTSHVPSVSCKLNPRGFEIGSSRPPRDDAKSVGLSSFYSWFLRRITPPTRPGPSSTQRRAGNVIKFSRYS